MHEIEWRDWVRQCFRGLTAQLAALEARVAALEEKRRGVGHPWVAEGTSRSAWYRRRKAEARVGP
jgi:hypothetical protein